MGGQYPERVALGLTTKMLEELRQEAQRHGRTVLAQIRFFCEEGLQLAHKTDAIEYRIANLEQRLQSAEQHVPYGESRGRPTHKKTGNHDG